MAVKRYDGSAWQTVAGLGAQGPAATSSSIATWVKTASGGETSVSGNDDSSQPLSYTVGQELVFINGVLQKRGDDYTATTGNSITGLTALTAGDIVSVWTVNAFSVTNAISNTIVDAKGDILVGTGADTPGRLAVGTNDYVLTADSTTGTGLKWAAPAAGGMTLLSTTTFSGSSITVSSISQDYTDLVGVIVDLYANNTGNGTYIRFNGDTGSNYAYSGVRNIGTTVSAQASLSDTRIILVPRSATSNTDKKKTFGTFTIPKYTGSHNKLIVNRTNGSDETDGVSMHNVGMWDDTTAVSSLVLFGDYTFSGGTLYLYGVK